MTDIFISYSREDRARVKPLAEALQNTCGWSVWWDVRIPAGKTFDEVIESALDKARCVIVVWSETSVNSRWVRTEAAEGLDRGVLVPVAIDNIKIPLAFRRIQTENFSTWEGDANAEVFQKMRGDISNILGELTQKNPVATKETSKQSRAATVTKKFELDTNGKQEFRTIVSKSENQPFQLPEMVRVTGGKFLMGSPESEEGRFDDEQQHEVYIDDFAIGVYPVTFSEYDRYCEKNVKEKTDDETWGRENRPVINVTWEDAYNYAQWLAKVTGQPYRLPTEAEWEYAARGATNSAYWWGDEFEQEHINCDGKHGKTTPVNTFKPNPFGLFDTSGNVWEWTSSLYKEDYDGSEKECADKGNTNQRVIRGGSWDNIPWNARSAGRNRYYPNSRFHLVGFRLALD